MNKSAVDELFRLDRVRSYTTLELRNTGSKKISGVVLRIVGTYATIQYQLDGEDITKNLAKPMEIEVGDLRPKDQRLGSGLTT